MASGDESSTLGQLRAVRDREAQCDPELLRRVESALFPAREPARDRGGPTVSRYRLLERLGAGGFGVVYRAHDPELHRDVAIKLIRADRLRTIEAVGGRERVLREARAIARLDHPNVVRVFDVGSGTGQLGEPGSAGRGGKDAPRPDVFIVMELLVGGALSEWLEADKRSHRAILDVFVAAGRGLAAAHQAGIVHRDFKPANVFVSSDGGVRVLDFGLARFAHALQDDDEVITASHGNAWSGDIVTDAGADVGTFKAAGTPAYMAPEVQRGAAGDARSDQFSFVVALVEGLTGQRPFRGGDVRALYDAKMDGLPERRLREAGVDPGLVAVLRRGAAPRPEDRFEDMAALLDELQRAARRRPRRVAGLAAFALGGATAVVGIAVWPDEPACEDGRLRAEGHWNAATKEAVSTALARANASYGPDAWVSVERHVDRFVADWTAAVTAACTAAEPRTNESEVRLDAQMGCLNAQLSELQAVIEVASQGEAVTAARAPGAAAKLGSPLSCLGRDGTLAEPVPPDDAALRAAVASLRVQLGRARGYHATGRYDRGVEVVQGIYQEAEALGYPPLMAEVLYGLGTLQIAAGELETGRTTLERAWSTAEAARHDRVAAVVAARLVSVVGYHLADLDGGLTWARHAEAALARVNRPEGTEAQLVHNLGLLYSRHGRVDEAEAQYRRALALYRAAEGDDVPDVATCLNNLGSMVRLRGRPDEAIVHFERALEIVARTYGRSHPDYAATYANLGLCLSDVGRYDEAMRVQRKVVELRRAAHGPGHPGEVASLANVMVLHHATGEYRAALEVGEHAFELARGGVGEQHPLAAALLMNLGATYRELGDLQTSLDRLERGHAIMQRTLGPVHPDQVLLHLSLARTLARLGRLDEAATRADEGFTMASRLLRPHDPTMAEVYAGRGEIRRARGMLTLALADFEASWSIAREADLPPLRQAHNQFLLAQTLADLEREPARAHAMAHEAMRVLAESGPDHVALAREIERFIERTAGAR